MASESRGVVLVTRELQRASRDGAGFLSESAVAESEGGRAKRGVGNRKERTRTKLGTHQIKEKRWGERGQRG